MTEDLAFDLSSFETEVLGELQKFPRCHSIQIHFITSDMLLVYSTLILKSSFVLLFPVRPFASKKFVIFSWLLFWQA